jgi:hypothetical protein
MGAVAIGFGIAASAVAVLTFVQGRRRPAFPLALMLLAFWATANLSPPWLDPWVDACGFYAALLVWLDQRKPWMIVLGAAFLAQMVLHLALLAHPWYRQLALNLLFAVELAAVAAPGLIDALQRHYGRLRSPLDRARSLGFLGRSPR